MAKKNSKIKVLTETEAEKQYYVATGFNLTRGESEVRFDRFDEGKPVYVTEKDFDEKEFKEVLKLEVIKPVLAPEETAEGLEDPEMPVPQESNE